MSERPVLLLKRILLGLWAAWLTVVLATNAADAAKALGLLGEGWALASGNYRLVAEATSRYGMPAWVNGLLFLGVLLWQGVAAVLFGLACWRFRGRAVASSRPPLYAAFTAGLTLWAAFLVADEVLVAYAVAATHLRLSTAQLATLLAVELLPEGTAPAEA